jgi:gluconate 2-dehydrogenase gamma chain
MDRRKYLKSMTLSTVGVSLLLESCNKKDGAKAPDTKDANPELTIDRTAEEMAREKKLLGDKFFTEHEMKTISVLSDIIIPKDEKSGSATDAGVPDFIEFIVKDKPELQTPMRGGLKWLDLQCMRRYKNSFIESSNTQQIELVDAIAYPEKATKDMDAGVAFFNRMRDLTATGFFTSKIGIADLGYVGNRPNQWNGVPQDVLDQYGVKYDQRTLDISAKYE